MRGTKTFGLQWWALGILCVCALTRPAAALYLDEDQNISLRTRIYSQASFRLNDSQTGTTPRVKRGQLVQHRNFFNPELDAKLTSYLSGLRGTALGFLAPDDLTFRVAAWGFYDGIYDYGPRQFGDAQRNVNSTFGNVAARPLRGWFIEGPAFNGKALTVDEIFPGHEVKNHRDIYATQRRVNELYLSYSKGPVFFRIGRQSISWGEADTVALLDQNNPFDVTLSAPGVFEDLDEARIPLWTVRASLNLFDTIGPLSSGFVEAYWVPGDLDVNTGIVPILAGGSPYAVRGDDPQKNPLIVNFNTIPGSTPFQFVLLDHVPQKSFENSRWGVRVQTVVERYFTVSAWYYTHFPNAPVPRKLPNASIRGKNTNLFVIETVHDLTSVIGMSNTFFLEPIDSIVRMEAEYFDNEPAFIPQVNMQIPKNPLFGSGEVAKADFLRGELGVDRFFFMRALNPTNSFTLVTALVASYNLDETSKKDYRSSGQQKAGASGQKAEDFVQQKKVEAFAQIHLQTDYMHGRLSPDITYIQNFRGTYAVMPAVTYRLTDWLLFNVKLVHIGGEYQQLGFFRDRDQVWFRATYQLN